MLPWWAVDPSRGVIRTGRLVKGKWQIDARLGAGATATVYAATHKNNGLKVAIKVLKPELARDQEMRSRFLREGYVANQIQHPGVVRVLDDDTAEDGSVFLVMELLEGEMLESKVAREGGKLSVPEVVSVADRVLDVLAAAHTQGIVHRDIKPENIFITRDGGVKILDFGLAQFKQGQDATRTGLILGTPDFMSPEQAAGNSAAVDARSDLYALGAVMFTLLTGKPVHKARSLHEHLILIASATAPSIGTLAPNLPRDLVALVDCALQVEKERRWANAREMQRALRDMRRAADSEPPDAETIVSEIAAPVSSKRGMGPVSIRGPMEARPFPTEDELDETKLVATGEFGTAGVVAAAAGLEPPASSRGRALPPANVPSSQRMPFPSHPHFVPAPPPSYGSGQMPYDPARFSQPELGALTTPARRSSSWVGRVLLVAVIGMTLLLVALVPVLKHWMAERHAAGAATSAPPAPSP